MNAPTVALACIALALSLEEAGAGVHVSAQIDHLVITVVDLTPNNSKPAGYEFLPIDLESRLGVASVAGSDRIATFHDRDTAAALSPRYAMDDALSIDLSRARISNDGQPDLLRASAGSDIAGGLANSQVAGEYLFNLLPQTQLNFTVHASLTGDSLTGDRLDGDTGFALVQMNSVSTPEVPETAQAIYLGRVWPTGKKSDSPARLGHRARLGGEPRIRGLR